MYIRAMVFGFFGGLAGFFYWYFAGCISGTCPLQSNPVFDIIYGILMGLLLTEFVKPKKENGSKKSIGIK